MQSNRFGLSRSKDAKKAAANAADAEPATPDFSAKLLHLAWHPEAPLIAAAGAYAWPRCLCLSEAFCGLWKTVAERQRVEAQSH